MSWPKGRAFPTPALSSLYPDPGSPSRAFEQEAQASAAAVGWALQGGLWGACLSIAHSSRHKPSLSLTAL